jgi:hypothetical protein
MLVSPGTRSELAERAAIYAFSHTRGQLRAWLARHVARLDPAAAEKRRKKEKARRRVWVQPETDGMATIGAYLTAEEAQACYNALLSGAANHEGGVDAARAGLFVERLTGLAPSQPVPVQIIVTPTGTELAGHGPLSVAHAGDLCADARRIEFKEAPQTGLGYRPGPMLARYVKARDRHCRFPGCRRPAAHCDLDHITPYPAGPTSAANLQCLCRYHHRLKTHAGWTVRPSGMALQWTSPRGRTYRTRADDP